MEIIGGWLLVWLVHAGTAAALSAPVVLLGRTRVRWHAGELLAFVVPFVVWTAMMFSDVAAGKSMSNFAIELLGITAAVPLAAVVRVAIGQACSERLTSGVLILVLAAVAAAVYWFVPALPE